jgi:hypothetical protein
MRAVKADNPELAAAMQQGGVRRAQSMMQDSGVRGVYGLQTIQGSSVTNWAHSPMGTAYRCRAVRGV